MLAAFFGLNFVFDTKPQVWMDFAMLCLFYGLYFGVLGRDVAEICADKMASHIGVSCTFNLTKSRLAVADLRPLQNRDTAENPYL